MDEPPGDFPPDAFRAMGHAAVERLARYFETLETRPVLARTRPGEVLAQLPRRAPEDPEPWEAIERDLDRLVEPNLTHWQHPGYFAYFANTGSAPGVVGDFLAAGYNQVGILWRTSPVLTELEQGVVRWLLDLVGLPWGPGGFDGQLADTASTASLIALAAAREEAFPDVRRTGLAGRARGVVYCSELAHSSIDKACVVLGLGIEGLRKIPVDAEFRIDAGALESEIAKDRALGCIPVAVVATAGTTAVTSVDPLQTLADLCERERIWLARRRGLRGLGGGAARNSASLRGLGARGLGRLQPAQVDARAARVHRALLPPHGARPARLLRGAELSRDARGRDGARIHGLRRAARPPVPGPQDVDDAARLRGVRRESPPPQSPRPRARPARRSRARERGRDRGAFAFLGPGLSVGVPGSFAPGRRRGERPDPRPDQRGRPHIHLARPRRRPVHAPRRDRQRPYRAPPSPDVPAGVPGRRGRGVPRKP